MDKVKPYIDEDGEVRELDDHFFANAKRGRPPMPAEDRKQRVNLTLPRDVVAALKARGAMSTEATRILREGLGL
jgi:uncharacterized protein (DUF4415 family)